MSVGNAVIKDKMNHKTLYQMSLNHRETYFSKEVRISTRGQPPWRRSRSWCVQDVAKMEALANAHSVRSVTATCASATPKVFASIAQAQ